MVMPSVELVANLKKWAKKTLPCARCGVEFTSRNESPKYCSRACKDSAQTAVIDMGRIAELYASGLTQQEIARRVGTTQKAVYGAMKRADISARPAIKREQRGDANSSWKGDVAGYDALHVRLHRAKGLPSHCEVCGESDVSRRYEWANLTGNYKEINDYKRMCVPCHRRYDAARRRSEAR